MHGEEKNELAAKEAEKFKEEQDLIDAELAQLSNNLTQT